MAIQAMGKSVDVQSQLMQLRRRKRPLGVVPYPVRYTNTQITYDDWNLLFCKRLFGNPSVHVFTTPPAKVLDLGCGGGLWVLEAAKHWPTSHFVGFDLLRIQPDVHRIPSDIPDATRRIRWIHVRRHRLDPLPFASGTFDFVRISGVGLGVPEDEWQDLFQEVSRIMKPDAIVEIMEEDLLFPSGNFAKLRDPRPAVPAECPPESPTSTSSPKTPSAIMSSSPSRTIVPLPTKSPRSVPQPLKDTPSSSASSVGANGPSSLALMSLLALERLHKEYENLEFEELLDPRDHSKLKTAWNNMLERRFLAPGVLAVLPFYLSAEFTDVQIKTALNVPLPSNSIYVPSDDEIKKSPLILPSRPRSNTLKSIASVLEEMPPHPAPDPAELLAADCASNYRERSRSVTTSSWASMHLAKTVSTLQGCKEAIWEEYNRLGCAFTTTPSVDVTRNEFLVAWSNWEQDMKNRIGMRSNIPRFASWNGSFPGDDPEWKAWRARKAAWDLKEADQSTAKAPIELCRSIRGFVARKPSATPKG